LMTASDPELPDEHPKSGHRGEGKRTLEGLKLPASPPQGMLPGPIQDQEGTDGGRVA